MPSAQKHTSEGITNASLRATGSGTSSLWAACSPAGESPRLPPAAQKRSMSSREQVRLTSTSSLVKMVRASSASLRETSPLRSSQSAMSSFTKR